MKKAFAAFVAVLLLCLLAGLGQARNQEYIKVNALYGVSMELPADWTFGKLASMPLAEALQRFPEADLLSQQADERQSHYFYITLRDKDNVVASMFIGGRLDYGFLDGMGNQAEIRALLPRGLKYFDRTYKDEMLHEIRQINANNHDNEFKLLRWDPVRFIPGASLDGLIYAGAKGEVLSSDSMALQGHIFLPNTPRNITIDFGYHIEFEAQVKAALEHVVASIGPMEGEALVMHGQMDENQIATLDIPWYKLRLNLPGNWRLNYSVNQELNRTVEPTPANRPRGQTIAELLQAGNGFIDNGIVADLQACLLDDKDQMLAEVNLHHRSSMEYTVGDYMTPSTEKWMTQRLNKILGLQGYKLVSWRKENPRYVSSSNYIDPETAPDYKPILNFTYTKANQAGHKFYTHIFSMSVKTTISPEVFYRNTAIATTYRQDQKAKLQPILDAILQSINAMPETTDKGKTETTP